MVLHRSAQNKSIIIIFIIFAKIANRSGLGVAKTLWCGVQSLGRGQLRQYSRAEEKTNAFCFLFCSADCN
jgi:hypothetical protein